MAETLLGLTSLVDSAKLNPQSRRVSHRGGVESVCYSTTVPLLDFQGPTPVEANRLDMLRERACGRGASAGGDIRLVSSTEKGYTNVPLIRAGQLFMVLNQEEIEKCREAFERFDKDGSGTIDAWELKETLKVPEFNS